MRDPVAVGSIAIPSSGRKYSLRGVVEGNGVVKTGGLVLFGRWRIFGNSVPTITVRINPDQLQAFNRLAEASMSVQAERPFRGIASDLVPIGMRMDLLSQFPIGSNVGLTFVYQGPINQFFLGAEVLRLQGMVVVTDDSVLENEVLVN